jgi:hypothetical protein
MTDTIDRCHRVVDMMLTMHSILRDRYQRRAATLDMAILAISVALCALTFADERVLRYFVIRPETSRDLVSATGVLLFSLAVLSLRVDWKQEGSRHNRACEILARAKATLRECDSGDAAEDVRWINALLADLPAVPERSFLALKAAHLRKVECSRLLNANPGIPLFLLRALLTVRAAKRAIREQKA